MRTAETLNQRANSSLTVKLLTHFHIQPSASEWQMIETLATAPAHRSKEYSPVSDESHEAACHLPFTCRGLDVKMYRPWTHAHRRLRQSKKGIRCRE
jgi:hypothetical protein